MSEHSDHIHLLEQRLEMLSAKQESFRKEINELKIEIARFKVSSSESFAQEQSVILATTKLESEKEISIRSLYEPQEASTKQKEPLKQTINKTPKAKSDLEKFIGENLINKIGIAITVIGVSIGAKYAIDHELISPLTRIILGYLAGIGLMGFAIYLKKNYLAFSAVLLSGSMAIFYFITYVAYSFYGLFPQSLSFVIMVLFTVFTVLAAIQYNNQIIAHIGLVGAYAVPLLLSEGSGEIGIMFTYMTIINIGILFTSFKKYWRSLYIAAFAFTWLIFFSWYASRFDSTLHFGLALSFATIFFLIFYLTFLAYKLIQKEQYHLRDIMLLLSNSFVYFGIGYSILSGHQSGRQLLGLFTLSNAIIHFFISVLIFKQKLADKNLFFLVSGLVLVFITIAVPVQLDGNWVTLLWTGEATLLFWIGRTKKVSVYETLSYPLMLLSFISIIHDWSIFYNSFVPGYPETKVFPIFNIYFLSSILFLTGFIVIDQINRNKNVESPIIEKWLIDLTRVLIPSIVIIAAYFSLQFEIKTFFDQKYLESAVEITDPAYGYVYSIYDTDYLHYKSVWLINYSMLFLSVLSFINVKKIKNISLASANLLLNTFALLAFLTAGLYALNMLRANYQMQMHSEYFSRSSLSLFIRYICFPFVGGLIYMCYQYSRQSFFSFNTKLFYDFLLHTTLLWIASSELINWISLYDDRESNKLGLSILWGLYSLMLIGIGIWKNKKHLRIAAIVLFGVTLIKLFFYDISHLETIAKTIVLMSLGILLLIISFLYNKYKHLITESREQKA